jgi:hypothetical protein
VFLKAGFSFNGFRKSIALDVGACTLVGKPVKIFSHKYRGVHNVSGIPQLYQIFSTQDFGQVPGHFEIFRTGYDNGFGEIPIGRISEFYHIESFFGQKIPHVFGCLGETAAVEHLDLPGVGYKDRRRLLGFPAGKKHNSGIKKNEGKSQRRSRELLEMVVINEGNN